MPANMFFISWEIETGTNLKKALTVKIGGHYANICRHLGIKVHKSVHKLFKMKFCHYFVDFVEYAQKLPIHL